MKITRKNNIKTHRVHFKCPKGELLEPLVDPFSKI